MSQKAGWLSQLLKLVEDSMVHRFAWLKVHWKIWNVGMSPNYQSVELDVMDTILLTTQSKSYQIRSKTEIIAEDGSSRCINEVPYWDFNWQWFYFFSDTVPLMPGERLKVTCDYNTSADTSQIYFGEGTNDEMCVLVLYGTRTPL